MLLMLNAHREKKGLNGETRDEGLWEREGQRLNLTCVCGIAIHFLALLQSTVLANVQWSTEIKVSFVI